MDAKTNLVNQLTIQLADSCNISIAELQKIIVESLSNYTIAEMDSTLPSTGDGSTTMYIFKKFVQAKFNKGIADSSLRQYKYIVNQFWDFTHKEINNCTHDDINDFITSFKVKNLSSQTIRNKYQLLSSIFAFMKDFNYIAENPMNKISPPKIELTYEETISKHEEEQIRIVCEKMKPRESARSLAIFNFMLDSGVRVSEMCNINISDIDFVNREVHIRKGKGGKDRVVFFTEKTTVRLQEYFKFRTDVNLALFGDDVPLFTNLRGNGRIKKASVESLLHEIGTLANVSRLHPHLLRATFATRLVEKGVPINIVAEMLGHANLNTIDRYVRLTKSNKKSYIDHVA